MTIVPFLPYVFVLLLMGIGVFLWSRVSQSLAESQEEQALLEVELRDLLRGVAQTEAQLESAQKELGARTAELKEAATQRDRYLEGGKQLREQLVKVQAHYDADQTKLREVVRDKATAEQKLAEQTKKIEKSMTELAEAQKAFSKEKERIHTVERNAAEQAFAEKHRQWAEHETTAISQLQALCAAPETAFSCFDNNGAPAEMGKLKPDFGISFLEKYIIFDAKTKTAERDLNNYLAATAKSTAKKYASVEAIYSTVYFLIPSGELPTLRRTHFHEEGFDFYVIGIEAVGPILRAYKQIMAYETLSEWSPEERESIVKLFAQYDQHIAYRNALDVVMTRESLKLMNGKNTLNEEIQQDIESRKATMGVSRPSRQEIEAIAKHLPAQKKAVRELIQPQTPVPPKALEEAQQLL